MNWRAWASAFWQTVSPASHDEPWPPHAIISRRSSSDGYQRAIAASAAAGTPPSVVPAAAAGPRGHRRRRSSESSMAAMEPAWHQLRRRTAPRGSGKSRGEHAPAGGRPGAHLPANPVRGGADAPWADLHTQSGPGPTRISLAPPPPPRAQDSHRSAEVYGAQSMGRWSRSALADVCLRNVTYADLK